MDGEHCAKRNKSDSERHVMFSLTYKAQVCVCVSIDRGNEGKERSESGRNRRG